MYVRITFLGHSGFLLEWEWCYWIFDYEAGSIPSLDPAKKLFVFCSHSHLDHFNPLIFQVAAEHKNAVCVLAAEIKSAYKKWCNVQTELAELPPIIWIENEEDKLIDDGRGDSISVHALSSTDLGVGFYLEYQRKTIYHAGDLHWWYWPGEPEEENEQMTKTFRENMSFLENKSLDLVFAVLDPRQEEAYDWGLDYLLEKCQVHYVFPMHFWNDFTVISRYLNRKKSLPFGTKVINIGNNQQTWEVLL